MLRTIAPEIVACIARGGQPDETELTRVAAHIARDLTGRPIGTRPESIVSESLASKAIRAARVALAGAP